MKKVLILGANGMLGHDLVTTFDTDYEIVKTDVVDLDITKEEDILNKFREVKPDIVINAAAYTDVDKCEEEKELCNKINGYAIEYLVKACNDIDALFVHISTDYVFDGTNKVGYKEDDQVTNPVNQYGASKEIGEKFINDLGKKYYLIRTSWLYGKNGKNFVETMKGLGEKLDELKVVDDQHGKPTYTVDLAIKIKEMVEGEVESGIYHVTNEDETTWYDFASEIFRLSNIEVKVNACASSEFPRPAKRPEYSSLINTKLPKMRPWKDALKDYLNN